MEGYPVQEEQQDQGQMDSVLNKLQLELQQQLHPSQTSSAQADAAGAEQSCTSAAVSTQLVVSRTTPLELPGSPLAAAAPPASGDDVTLCQDDVTLCQDAATDSMHSELTLAQSSDSLGSSPASPAAADPAAAATAEDASTADAVSDAMAHSIPSAATTPAAAAAAPAALNPAAAGMISPAVLSPLGQSLTNSRAASDRCLSGTEDEWHMVSRGSSVKAPSSSGRYSFEDPEAAAAAAAAMAAAVAAVNASTAQSTIGSASPFHATDGALTDAGSECGSDITPRDELAASILGHPVMMAAAGRESASLASSPLRPASPATAEAGSADAAAAAAAGSAEAAAGSAEAAVGEVVPAAAAADGGSSGVEGEESAVVLDAQEAIGLLSGGLLQLAGGLREWIVESLAALVQTGRDSQAVCVSRASALLRSLQLSAKESGGLAAAAATAAGDWRLLLSSAAAVVCLALWMKSRKEASVLRAMLRRRDHELSKLVMRVVSLQELINQGGHLPTGISRYSRFEGAAVSATFM